MVFSKVIVDVTIPRRSFVFGQSRAKVSTGFTNLRSLAVAAFDLVCCSLSGLRFVFVARLLSGLWRDERNYFATHLTAYKTRLIMITTFLLRTITTRTSLDGTHTVTLIPTLRPTSTPTQLRQRLYRTSEAPLKISHVYYKLTIYVLHTNR